MLVHPWHQRLCRLYIYVNSMNWFVELCTNCFVIVLTHRSNKRVRYTHTAVVN
ncbi:hypothetical protein BDV35DRAFT_369360 [Aspergillus flavus]|uniref:Uncharacterized protein n=1 Tax=Aspergillus flavus TaxID=5059 RepID=A0A5N6GM48_ASPFL|nr:hypothetical protein BDV35DRAFT_369360 [Aspergillus flavus]